MLRAAGVEEVRHLLESGRAGHRADMEGNSETSKDPSGSKSRMRGLVVQARVLSERPR